MLEGHHGLVETAGPGLGGVPTAGADLSVVLVEDNPEDAELTLRTLRQHGLANDVMRFAAATPALEWLRQAEARRPRAIVLLDLHLPGMSGFDLLEAIRVESWGRETIVVVLTSANAFDDIATAYRLGADAVLFKPITFAELVARMGELGLGWRLVADPERVQAGRPAIGIVPAGVDPR